MQLIRRCFFRQVPRRLERRASQPPVETQFPERSDALMRTFGWRRRPAGALLFHGTPKPPARCRRYLNTPPHRSDTNPSPFAVNSNELVVSNRVTTQARL